MVTVYRPDTGESMQIADKYWLATLVKITPKNKLERISSNSFSIVIKGVKFVVSNDWEIDNQHFTYNTGYMIKHNLL